MILLLCLVFGLPFLAITDLFPLHRFGMFVQIPDQHKYMDSLKIEVKVGDKNWERLKTGNSYMDESYLPLYAKKSLRNIEDRKSFGDKIHKSLKEKPDSIQVIYSNIGRAQNLRIYPL